MPTYSYRCASCGHLFEKVQRITEDAIKVCPSCGAETASRLIQSGNFILKGGGWYGDLYAGGSNKKGEAPTAAPAAATTPAAPAAAGSDSKASPAAAPSAPAAAPSAPAASSTPAAGSSSS